MRVHIKQWLVAVTAIGMVLAAVVPALDAQNQTLPHTQPGAGISDRQLEAFAAAYVEIQQIQAEHQGEVHGVQDHNTLVTLQEKARTKMRAAVENEGLTVQEYNSIQAVIGTNEELRQKAVDLIEAEQKRR